MDVSSLDLRNYQLEKLREAFPEAISEQGIDWEKLRATLGVDVALTNERYVLNWAGKSDAFRAIQTPTTATLKPQRDQSIDFDTTRNIFIEGENLEVLKVIQKSYYGKVKMIYIDPPYNTGNDSFIYPDKFSESKADYLKRIGDKDEAGYLTKEGFFRKNSKENGQFHSNWLSMMYPRLFLARNLLGNDGVIFVSIDDHEVNNLRLILDEVFGEENFVAQLVWEKGRKNDARFFSVGHEYMLVYAHSVRTLRDKETIWREPKPGAEEIWRKYLDLRKELRSDQAVEDALEAWYRMLPAKHPSRKLSRYKHVDKDGPWRDRDISWPGGGGPRYDVIHPKTKKPCAVPERGWVFPNAEKMQRQIDLGLVEFREDHKKPPFRKAHLYPVSEEISDSLNTDETDDSEPSKAEEVGLQVMPSVIYKQSQVAVKYLRKLMDGKLFDNPKDHEVLARLIGYCTHPGDIVLDFFAGSASTAEAVFELNQRGKGNRQVILAQFPEAIDETSNAAKAGFRTIADLSKKRMRRAAKRIRDEIEERRDLLTDDVPDLGFKVFTLEPSNFKVWRTDVLETEVELKKQMEAFVDPVRARSKTADMAWELHLKSGYELTTSVEMIDLGGFSVHSIAGGELILILDKVTQGAIESVLSRKPNRVICLDSLFAGNDQLKTNTVLQMKDAGVEFRTI